jgi:excinuclease UvrABC nuclease subunit
MAVRGRDLFTNWKGGAIKHLFGPFPQGLALKEAMKLVRKIFPYRDEKCTPCEQQEESGKKKCRPCFNRQIGLCPGVCSGEVGAREYGEAVRHITLLFSGKKKMLVANLEKAMAAAAKEERYEDADEARRQIRALRHIQDVSLIKSESRFATGGQVRASSQRIEAFDIAHTAGTETVGVMTVVENGEIEKQAYRKFKVRGFTNNDAGALAEVLSRRFLHPEWPYPRLIVVDGSTAQMNAAKKDLENAGIQIPIVGVVKDEFHRPLRLAGNEKTISEHEKGILLANNEAHRFAIKWLRQRRRRAMV